MMRYVLCCLSVLVVSFASGAVPSLLNHQGRMAVNGVNFEGTGQFKFALVNTNGSTTYWSNDGTSSAGSQPTAAVSLTVTKGLYSVLLGDTAMPNMTAVPTTVFDNADVRLRVWFNDGTNGFQLITPDQRLAASPYALNASQAETVPNGSITSAKLASGLTLGGTTTGSFSGNLTGNASTATSATAFTGSLAGDVTGTQSTTSIAASTVTGKALAGFISGAGTVTGADSILSAINKLDGNIALKAPLASPTFSGIVTGTFSGNGAALTNLSGGSLAAGSVTTTQITDGTITNADINISAAIADSKLATISTAGKVANSATTGTAASTPSTLVLRDASGNFSAGTVTGTFVGDGSGLTNVSASNVQLANVVAPPVKPVVAWGNNHDGQTTVPALANVAAVAAGTSHSVALLDVGTVVQWGSIAAAPGTAVNVTHIATGTAHNLARKSDGTVIAWGANTYGQTTVPGGITTATNVSAGEKHSLALLANGTLVAWGDNTFGQTTIPGSATNVTAIACGYDHSLALKGDGTVVAWGRDDQGQVSGTRPTLGTIIGIIDATHYRLSKNLAPGTANLFYDGVAGPSSTSDGSDIVVADTTSLSAGMIVSAPGIVGPAGLTNVVAIAAGAYHSLAVKSDGTVVAWGWDTGGQVAGAASLTNVSKVAGGYAFTLALKTNGTLVAFGNNADLQLTLPTDAVNVTAIACGASHALALRADFIPAQVARLDQDNVFTGKVGIKRTPATNTLEVEGNASKTTAGNWLANSDQRIKTEVRPVTGALEKLNQVRLVDFRYTDDYRAEHPGIEDKRYLNVIAQEFQKVFPDDVKSSGERLPDGSDKILQVDTYPLTIYSAAAVQELAKENAALKKKLADQEERLRKIEAALGK